MTSRVQTIPFITQDYVSVQHQDDRIDMYITEPITGVQPTTGLMLLLHGWGNDGSAAYMEDSLVLADGYDLVVTRVEYRHSGREAHHPQPDRPFDVPYDFSKLQTIDCLRAAYATLDRYPQLNRQRMILWGGSQGGHLGAQCLVFAPHLWALAILACGVYLPMTGAETQAHGFSMDLRAKPGSGFVECALGQNQTFSPSEEDIRNPYRNAVQMPADVPVILFHGTADDTVDVKHSVLMYARLLELHRPVQFYAIANGDHGLALATFTSVDSRLKASLHYADEALRNARRADVLPIPPHPVHIPVRGGSFEVMYAAAGPTLVWMPDA